MKDAYNPKGYLMEPEVTVREPNVDGDVLAEIVRNRCADTTLRIGSRTSPMARSQAEHVKALIEKRVPGLEAEIVGVETSADLWEGDLAELGGKGNFTKEIDKALTGGQIDLAVHCLKDVPGDVPMPPGTEFAAYLERTDVHDVVVFPAGSQYSSLAQLPPGSIVGTSSVRRRAMLSQYRGDLHVERVRGNVNTRLRKLDTEGRLEAMILARPGLARIGMSDRAQQPLPLDYENGNKLAMVPAVGAGVIALQARSADTPVMRLLGEFNHDETAICATAERVMLHGLRGHCNSPIAGYAVLCPDGQINLRGMVFNRDGSQFVHAAAWHTDPGALGAMVSAELLRQGARELIMATRK